MTRIFGKAIEADIIIMTADKISKMLATLKFVIKIPPFINKNKPKTKINPAGINPYIPYIQKQIAMNISNIPKILTIIVYLNQSYFLN